MATPSLLMIPSAFKSGVLASVLPSDGTGDFTVSRPSVATRINSEGLIETMAANVARLDYSDGGCPVLLTEPQSTNLVVYSEDFTQGVLSDCTIQSGFYAPDGTTNAYKLIEDNTNSTKIFIALNNSLTTPNTSIASSIYVKAGERTKVRVLGYHLTNQNFYVDYDLTNNTYLDSGTSNAQVDGYSIEDIWNDGWKRITVIGQKNATYSWDVGVSPLDDNGNITYQGDGTSGLYIWGAQIEEQSFATSYIKTERTTATRLADVVTVTPPVGVTEIIETIDGVEQTPITTIPATYTVPVGNINSIEMN